MGSTGSPMGSMAHSGTPAVDAVSVWPNNTFSHTNFTISATLTPQQKGYLTIYPKVVGSLALYIDPKPVLS